MRGRPGLVACILAALIGASAAGAAMAELRQGLTTLPSKRGFTFLVELGNAPFPVGPGAVDHRGQPFWHGVDRPNGQRFRFLGNGRRYLEGAAYGDARVLFHVPRAFNAAKPFHLVIFMHGHDSDLERTLVRDYDLPGQIERAGVNAVLIAPQLARNAQDSVPGKFVEPGRATDFVDEAELVLHNVLGIPDAPLRAAPIVLAAFSGGYRTLAQILARGGLDDRIAGLVLLDALYADTEIYARWLDQHAQEAFAYTLYSPSSQMETAKLRAALRLYNVPFADEDDGGPMKGVRFVRTATPHGEIPVKGPPREPLAALLKRIAP